MWCCGTLSLPFPIPFLPPGEGCGGGGGGGYESGGDRCGVVVFSLPFPIPFLHSGRGCGCEAQCSVIMLTVMVHSLLSPFLFPFFHCLQRQRSFNFSLAHNLVGASFGVADSGSCGGGWVGAGVGVGGGDDCGV